MAVFLLNTIMLLSNLFCAVEKSNSNLMNYSDKVYFIRIKFAIF